MIRSALFSGLALLGACSALSDDHAGPPAEATTADPVFAYQPMGFARVTATGLVAVGFNSSLASISVGHSLGFYSVTFNGLGAPSGDGAGGDVQITTEGTGNTLCHTVNWGGSPNLIVNVQCAQPSGAAADAPFAITFFHNTMPAPNAFPTRAAYVWAQPSGAVSPFYDFNSSGTHNTITHLGTGSYTVNLPGATAVNASMMVTPYGGSGFGAACSVGYWGTGYAHIECRNASGALVDSAFSFSYSTSGPTSEQQGAHAWFDGSGASPPYSAALGKVEGCSVATVSGSRTGSLVTLVVSGDLGAWDGGAFLRASMASAYGAAGYCKVESLTVSGVAPSSTATTTLRCYDATGATLAGPLLTFTHLTSDAAGPC